MNYTVLDVFINLGTIQDSPWLGYTGAMVRLECCVTPSIDTVRGWVSERERESQGERVSGRESLRERETERQRDTDKR